MLRKTILVVCLGAMALATSACNTVQGLGRDIESVGKTGEDAIND